MPDEIKMDKKVFEALASETRINILKKLDCRQMTITEMSREMDMAKSSIHEHLAKMTGSGLVEKVEDGHKWTYYYLTRKGRNILHPHETAKILVLLGLSILALAGGITRILSMLTRSAGEALDTAMMEAAPAPAAAPRLPSEPEAEALSEGIKAAEAASGSEPALTLGIVLILTGIVLGFFAYRMWRRSVSKICK